jgi:hypothetical protein
MSDIPHGEIGASVADVIEAALPKGLHQTACLQLRRQILPVVRCEPTIEETEMIGYSLDVTFVARRSKVDLVACSPSLLDE